MDMAGKYQKSASETREKRKSEMADLTRKTAESVVEFIASGGKSGHAQPITSAPFNPVSGHRYRGSNWLLAYIYMDSVGSPDPRFLTYKQAAEYGENLGKNIHVRAGESSVTFLRPMVIKNNKDEDEITAAPEVGDGDDEKDDKSRIIWIPYRVFHASQIEGMPPWRSTCPTRKLDDGSLADRMNVDRVKRLVHDFGDAINVQVNVGEEGFEDLGRRYLAYYKSSSDQVWMRPEEKYRNRADYVTTLLHETYHATGHESRENRFLLGPVMTGQSKHEYAFEEVRAELFSLLSNSAFGIDERLSDGHKDYIDYYRKIAETDPGLIMRAAASAGSVFSGFMDFAHGEKPEQPWITRGSKFPMFFNPPARNEDGVPDVTVPADWTGEVSVLGVVEVKDDDNDEHAFIEPAEFHGVEPHFWGVYARCADGASEHVADLSNREDAEELRIAMQRSVDAILEQSRKRSEEMERPFIAPRRETMAETIERIEENLGGIVEWRAKPVVYPALTAPASESLSVRGMAVGIASTTGHDHVIEILDADGRTHYRHLVHGDVEILAAPSQEFVETQDEEAGDDLAPGSVMDAEMDRPADEQIDNPARSPEMDEREELRSFGFS